MRLQIRNVGRGERLDVQTKKRRKKMIPIEKLREIAKYAIDLGFSASITDDGAWATFERNNISLKYFDPQIQFICIEKIQIVVEQINLKLEDVDSFMSDMENAKKLAEMLDVEVAEK